MLAAVGALLAAAVTVLVGGTSGPPEQPPVLLAERDAPLLGTPADKALAAVQPGTCLTWTRADAGDLAATSCLDPHLFEVAADIDLTLYPGSEFGPDAPFPGTLRFTELRAERCVPAVQRYLDGRFDPYGVYSVGLINPGREGWAVGERTLRCGLQNVGRSGTLFPVTGMVADQDQSDVSPVGICLGIDSTLPTDPVACTEPHAAEAVAVVDLSVQFPAGFPSTADQDAFLEATCARSADAYIGVADGAAAKGLTVFWDNLRLESWTAGSRKVDCFVGQQLAQGGFAPVTGDSRGAVTVGDQPAPPAAAVPPEPATTAAAPTSGG